MGLEHIILQLLRSRRGRIIVALLSIAAATFFGLLSWPNVANSLKLAQHHEQCLAQVIEHRTTTGMHYFDGTYDIRYTFFIPGHGWYGLSEQGPLARQELWSSLPKKEWLEAIRTGVVPVVYCKDNPSLNCLERDSGSDANALIAFSIISGVGIAAAVIWLLRLIFFWPRPVVANVQWFTPDPSSSKLVPCSQIAAVNFLQSRNKKSATFRI